jgi:hypothetical protein
MLLWSPGSIKKKKKLPKHQSISSLPGKCLCAQERALGLDTADNPTCPMKREGAEFWLLCLEGWAEKEQKPQRDCSFSVTYFDLRKEEPDFHSRDGKWPNLTHTTCISLGHPTAAWETHTRQGRELVRDEGVTFIFNILTSNIFSASDTI